MLIQDLDACANGLRTSVETAGSWWGGGRTDCNACKDAKFHVIDHEEVAFLRRITAAKRLAYLDNTLLTIEHLLEYTEDLFPNLVFADGAWLNIRRLRGSDDENRRDIVLHLGVLNDYAPKIWQTYTQTNERQDALSVCGVTASIESVRTRGSERYMRHRDFPFRKRTVRCEWHTKLKPLTNRIHFRVEGEMVLVGTITDHLPLPG